MQSIAGLLQSIAKDAENYKTIAEHCRAIVEDWRALQIICRDMVEDCRAIKERC